MQDKDILSQRRTEPLVFYSELNLDARHRVRVLQPTLTQPGRLLRAVLFVCGHLPADRKERSLCVLCAFAVNSYLLTAYSWVLTAHCLLPSAL